MKLLLLLTLPLWCGSHDPTKCQAKYQKCVTRCVKHPIGKSDYSTCRTRCERSLSQCRG